MAINLQNAEFILSAASQKDFRRDGIPQVAFAGRSNVGKSSVINRLLGRKNFARVGAAPGKTIHINYVGPVIGSHTGAGVVALFFLGTER